MTAFDFVEVENRQADRRPVCVTEPFVHSKTDVRKPIFSASWKTVGLSFGILRFVRWLRLGLEAELGVP